MGSTAPNKLLQHCKLCNSQSLAVTDQEVVKLPINFTDSLANPELTSLVKRQPWEKFVMIIQPLPVYLQQILGIERRYISLEHCFMILTLSIYSMEILEQHEGTEPNWKIYHWWSGHPLVMSSWYSEPDTRTVLNDMKPGSLWSHGQNNELTVTYLYESKYFDTDNIRTFLNNLALNNIKSPFIWNMTNMPNLNLRPISHSIDSLVQNCSNSSTLMMELQQFCAKPLQCIISVW